MAAEWITAVATGGAFLFAAGVCWYDLVARRKSDRSSQARLFDAGNSESRWKAHPTTQDAVIDWPVDLRITFGSETRARRP